MANHQQTVCLILGLWLTSSSVIAGLLPEANGNNGYQYNRPTGTALDVNSRRTGAYNSVGRFLPGFDSASRGSGIYGGGPGGYNGYANGIGYSGRSGAYPGANAFNNGRGPYSPQGILPGYNAIPDQYQRNYNDESGPPRPYSFQYDVRDPQSGNDYGHQESSDGNVVRGEFRTLLPDSRYVITQYTADDVNGYNADVRYEGQPQYPRAGGGGYQFNGPEGSYQPGFGNGPYQGRGGYNVQPGGYPTNGNGIFSNTNGNNIGVGSVASSNQYLPPTTAYRK